MRESTTYQAILREGRKEGREEGSLAEARKVLLLLGECRFGAPDAQSRAILQEIGDLKRLEELSVRLLAAANWHDLFAQPTPRRKNGRRRPRS